MNENDQHAATLADLLDRDLHAIAKALVSNADGHDARIAFVKSLLTLAGAVAGEVSDDMSAVGDGYDVCSETGETHAGNGTEGEGRALALHQYACSAACGHAFLATMRAGSDFEERIAAANAIPAEVTAADYLVALEAL